MFARLPTAMVLIKFSSKHRLICSKKIWKGLDTRYNYGSSDTIESATVATRCATLAVHARDPFPVSAHVCCRLDKSPSFSFCQVDMYAHGFCHGICSRLVFVALTLFQNIFKLQPGPSHIMQRNNLGRPYCRPTVRE